MEYQNFDHLSVDEMLANFDADFDYSGLPSRIIITNVPLSAFTDSNVKKEFEKLFSNGDHVVKIIYLPSFKRVRVEFDSPKAATFFRITLHDKPFQGNLLKAYFIEIPPENSTDPYLKLPPPFKNFLISPPTSPPEGWEQVSEAQPIQNLDLLSALAQLTPGETHELQPETQGTPKIVVHIAEEEEEDESGDSDQEGETGQYSGHATSTGEEDNAGLDGKTNDVQSSDPTAPTPASGKKRRKKKKKSIGDKEFAITKASAIHTPRPPLKT